MSLSDYLLLLQLFWESVLSGTAAGAALGILGVYVVLRRMVFLSAALTSAAGLGVALAFLVGILTGMTPWPALGAIATALVAGVAMSRSTEGLKVSPEAVLALVWVIGSAGAVLVGEHIAAESHDIANILFGNAVAVSREDMVLVVVSSTIAILFSIFARRGLVYVGFDADGAAVQDVPARLLEATFLATVTIVVSICTRALGVLPVFAFSVLPALAALIAFPRLSIALWVALGGGAFAGFGGYSLSIFLDQGVGATQALVGVLLVLVALPIWGIRRALGTWG